MTSKMKRLIEENSLSLAWAKALIRTHDEPGNEVVPLHVSIRFQNGDDPGEIKTIRDLLDKDLAEKKKSLCSTVSGTIFPLSMWNSELPAKALFDRYIKALPQIRKCKQNANGIYFERLIQYGEGNFNQLEFFIDSRMKRNNHRRSILQAAIAEPAKDLTDQRMRGFPCLQQVSFAKFGQDELAVNGFYGTQYIYDKAYGNYLGLFHLGKFVAHELDLRLTQLNCFSGIAKLGETKRKVSPLVTRLTKFISDLEAQ